MDEKIKYIADYYGKDEQERQLMEELAELLLAKNLLQQGIPDKRIAGKRFTGEMVDVCIMIKQLYYLYGLPFETFTKNAHQKRAFKFMNDFENIENSLEEKSTELIICVNKIHRYGNENDFKKFQSCAEELAAYAFLFFRVNYSQFFFCYWEEPLEFMKIASSKLNRQLERIKNEKHMESIDYAGSNSFSCEHNGHVCDNESCKE